MTPEVEKTINDIIREAEEAEFSEVGDCNYDRLCNARVKALVADGVCPDHPDYQVKVKAIHGPAHIIGTDAGLIHAHVWDPPIGIQSVTDYECPMGHIIKLIDFTDDGWSLA